MRYKCVLQQCNSPTLKIHATKRASGDPLSCTAVIHAVPLWNSTIKCKWITIRDQNNKWRSDKMQRPSLHYISANFLPINPTKWPKEELPARSQQQRNGNWNKLLATTEVYKFPAIVEGALRGKESSPLLSYISYFRFAVSASIAPPLAWLWLWKWWYEKPSN